MRDLQDSLFENIQDLCFHLLKCADSSVEYCYESDCDFEGNSQSSSDTEPNFDKLFQDLNETHYSDNMDAYEKWDQEYWNYFDKPRYILT